MANFFLTKKAVQDLERIWDYTVETWSEKQAETYYELIIESCQRLVEEPMRGKFYEVIDKNILGYKTGEHISFIEFF